MIQAVIFDWAGTTVDYGCFAPLNVFIQVFRIRGIEVTAEEARRPMGLLKRDHIQAICRMERIAALWKERFGRLPDESDVDALYADFEPLLFEILPNYAEPIPGILELVDRLRGDGLKIGSTTGYTAAMMDIVAPEARKRGYAPDVLVTPNHVPAGRPYPWMIYSNAMQLGVYPMKHIVKVGDTVSDVQEGVNAGVWSVGVVTGGSELGMSLAEVQSCHPAELAAQVEIVTERFKQAGAHYTIYEIGELPNVIEQINERLAKGERP